MLIWCYFLFHFHNPLAFCFCFETFSFPFSLCVPQHEERAFVLKFCAMEIYNESIRDLLSTDSTPLRVLDDPEVTVISLFVLPTHYIFTFDLHLQLFLISLERDCGGENHGGNT